MRTGTARRGAAAAAGVRTLHLVDLENVVGDPFPDVAVARAALLDCLERTGWQDGDHVCVAGNPWVLTPIAFDPPVPMRALPARGVDGADLALLATADARFVARRFERLVVASGDHIFRDLVADVLAAGRRVVVASVPRSRAAVLAATGADLVDLVDLDDRCPQ